MLGHSNFDGDDLAVGDSILFKEGTFSEIVPEQQFYTWGDTSAIDLSEAIMMMNESPNHKFPEEKKIESFDEIFELFRKPKSKRSYWEKIFSK